MSFAVAILVLLVVWVAVRAVGPAEASRQPAVVLPSMPQVPVEPSVAPSSPPSPSSSSSPSSASPSPSASSASPSPSRSSAQRSVPPTVGASSPSVRVTTAPVPSKTTQSAAPAPAAAATLSVNASWQTGYVATARLQNTGTAPLSWRMTVSHSGLENLRLLGVWNARGSRDGETIILTGGPLAPGASITFGYQVSKSGRGDARPSGCTVVGGSCRMS